MQFNATSMQCKIILKPWQDDDASNISNDAKNRHKSLHHSLNHNAADGHGHGHGNYQGPGYILGLGRDTRSQNFPVCRISRPKTFRTECVNRFRDIYAPKCVNCFCDIYAPKVRKSSLSKKFQYYMESFQTICTLSRPSGNLPHRLETFWTVWKISKLP